jgi:GntP family gluconate:H+ symporter
MSDQVLLFVNAAVAIVGIVVSITWLKFPPVFALLLGTLYLGVTTKLGFEGTPDAISDGFADVMGDIGVLVTFGVILGALLTVTNTMQRLVEAMLRWFGERSVPYVFAAALSSLFSSIYSDVLLVLSAPLARRLGPRMGSRGLALMGGALTAGIEVGLVFVAPGVAAVAIAGILDVPLGQMFLLGLAVGLPTALLTMFAFQLLLPVMGWNAAVDEIDYSTVSMEATPILGPILRTGRTLRRLRPHAPRKAAARQPRSAPSRRSANSTSPSPSLRCC